MHAHHLSPPGFKITVSSFTADEPTNGELNFDLNQFEEQLSQMIGTHLNPAHDLQIKVRIEHWDEVFSVEETVFNIRKKPAGASSQDYKRNYWIST